MNIRKLEDLTKEELIELVKHEREHIADTRNMVSDGWKLVPVEQYHKFWSMYANGF